MAAENDSSFMDSSLEVKDEGYDNEFVPANHRYECPICLMCLKEPYQTDCGHRFCKACIHKWLKSEIEGRRKCPACNEILSLERVYPDNFAKREICILIAKCRFVKHGCEEQDSLKTILKHQEECPYRIVPCTNQCGMFITYSQLESHISTQCSKRTMECTICRHQVQLSNMETHKMRCAMVSNSCPHCGESLSQQGENYKLHECPAGISALQMCRFYRFGCTFKGSITDMKYHMEQAQVEHLSCLACALETVMNVQPLSNISDMQALEEHLSSLLSARNYNSTPEVEDCKDVSMKSLQGAAAAPPEMYSPKKEKTFEYPGTLESEALSELRNKVANQQQYILELRSKVSYLENSLQDIRTELRDTKQELRCRVCEGSYIWRLNNYQKLREEAMAGGSNCVLHSPGFYTSYNGYLFCIRLNLNGVETAQGTHLSLFIHLMRSENDDILSWPFTGKIVLSILDQSSNVNKRKPITETLVAKPGLAAFQRPTSYRNHKGFGFMEFAPISFLESSDREFIKSDTLLIRADIKPTPNMS